MDTSFYYKYVAKDLFGVVNWNLIFEWHELSDEDKAKKVWSKKPDLFICFNFFCQKLVTRSDVVGQLLSSLALKETQI